MSAPTQQRITCGKPGDPDRVYSQYEYYIMGKPKVPREKPAPIKLTYKWACQGTRDLAAERAAEAAAKRNAKKSNGNNNIQPENVIAAPTKRTTKNRSADDEVTDPQPTKKAKFHEPNPEFQRITRKRRSHNDIDEAQPTKKAKVHEPSTSPARKILKIKVPFNKLRNTAPIPGTPPTPVAAAPSVVASPIEPVPENDTNVAGPSRSISVARSTTAAAADAAADSTEDRRKVISNFFGRNKKATNIIDKDVWHTLSRKAYQTQSYLANHTTAPEGNVPFFVGSLEIQLKRLELWRPDALFVVQLTAAAHTRISEYNAELAKNGHDAAAAEASVTKPPRVNNKRETVPPPLEHAMPMAQLLAFDAAFCGDHNGTNGTKVSYAGLQPLLQWIHDENDAHRIKTMPPFELLINEEAAGERVVDPTSNYNLWIASQGEE